MNNLGVNHTIYFQYYITTFPKKVFILHPN